MRSYGCKAEACWSVISCRNVICVFTAQRGLSGAPSYSCHISCFHIAVRKGGVGERPHFCGRVCLTARACVWVGQGGVEDLYSKGCSCLVRFAALIVADFKGQSEGSGVGAGDPHSHSSRNTRMNTISVRSSVHSPQLCSFRIPSGPSVCVGRCFLLCFSTSVTEKPNLIRAVAGKEVQTHNHMHADVELQPTRRRRPRQLTFRLMEMVGAVQVLNPNWKQLR